MSENKGQSSKKERVEGNLWYTTINTDLLASLDATSGAYDAISNLELDKRIDSKKRKAVLLDTLKAYNSKNPSLKALKPVF